MYGTKHEGNEEDMRHRISKLNIDNKSIIISHMPPYKCLDKANNTLVFNCACDETTTRGWIADLETSKYEKVIL